MTNVPKLIVSLASLSLSSPVPGVEGCTLSLEGVPKAGFTFSTEGNKLDTGTDFRYSHHVHTERGRVLYRFYDSLEQCR